MDEQLAWKLTRLLPTICARFIVHREYSHEILSIPILFLEVTIHGNTVIEIIDTIHNILAI